MSRRIGLAVVLAVLILAAVAAVVSRLVAKGSPPGEAEPDPAFSQEAGEAVSALDDPVPEKKRPNKAEEIGWAPFIGSPEDYGLDVQEFHRLRLRSQTLGQPEAGEGPVAMPAFKYVTLDYQVDIDTNKALKERMKLYEAVLAQRILTAATFTILMHKVDTKHCEQNDPEAYWEPALPVMPDVVSVKPPLVLKEQPASQVIVRANQPMKFDVVAECNALQQYTGGRFAGTIIFRMPGRIPPDAQITDNIRADFVLLMK